MVIPHRGRGYPRPVRLPIRLVAPLAALAVASGVAGCGSDDDARPALPTTTAAEQLATGLGFEVQLPPGWTDVSDQLNSPAVRYDVAAADTGATGFKTNVTVLRNTGSGVRGKTLEALDAAARRAAARDPKLSIRQDAPTTLDGEPATMSTSRRTQDGDRLIGRQVLALHAGELYVVFFTSAADDPRAAATFRTMLSTWRWTR